MKTHSRMFMGNYFSCKCRQLKLAINLRSTLFQIKPIFKLYQSSIEFHIEISHLICKSNDWFLCAIQGWTEMD